MKSKNKQITLKEQSRYLKEKEDNNWKEYSSSWWGLTEDKQKPTITKMKLKKRDIVTIISEVDLQNLNHIPLTNEHMRSFLGQQVTIKRFVGGGDYLINEDEGKNVWNVSLFNFQTQLEKEASSIKKELKL
jgi:hypothetical protein